MKEETQLTCQTELLLAKMVLDKTANGLQKVEHLGERTGKLMQASDMEGKRDGMVKRAGEEYKSGVY